MMGFKQKIFLSLFVVVLVFSLNINAVSAIQYVIDQEWVTLWINEDASIELHYNITITYESDAQGYITIGLPARGFNIVSVKDLSGNTLNYDDVTSGSYYAVEVYFGHPMNPGENGTVLLIATVPNMVFSDEMNPGYVGMNFTATYFDATTVNLRVAIVPPEGVTEDNIKTSETAFFTTVDGDFAVYWEHSNLLPNTQLTFGVSVPEEYVTLPETGPDIWFYAAIIAVVVAFFAGIILFRRRKKIYEKPKIQIEALGPSRSLTAVEAAVVVDLKPVKVLTMVLFGLLLKGLIMIKETEPLIKLEKLKSSETPTLRPRYYEIDFLNAIEPNGSLNERRLARTYLYLRENVDKKMQGYARVDTINYYKSIINTAWNQVKKANTPQLAEEAIEKNLEWLLLDEKYEQRFKESLLPNLVIIPRPHWYWYGSRFPMGRTPTPTPTEVKPIPAQEFADRIVTGIERASEGLVKNVEDFTQRLIPPKVTTQSSKPVRQRSSCVCACANCACACACVSCACACAGGGAR